MQKQITGHCFSLELTVIVVCHPVWPGDGSVSHEQAVLSSALPRPGFVSWCGERADRNYQLVIHYQGYTGFKIKSTYDNVSQYIFSHRDKHIYIRLYICAFVCL